MNLFGIKARRTAARPVLARPSSWMGTLGGGAAGAVPRSWEEQVRSAYLSNPVAQRACRIVAEALAGAPVTASDPRALALVADACFFDGGGAGCGFSCKIDSANWRSRPSPALNGEVVL